MGNYTASSFLGPTAPPQTEDAYLTANDLDNRHISEIIKKYTPGRIMAAARTFKHTTSIGGDHCAFQEIALAPDSALNRLGVLLAVMRLTRIPPLQSLLNMMAILPQKTGDTRTVASYCSSTTNRC